MGSLQVPGSATTPVARPKLPASKPTANRLPPPTLFQGPPSRNASNISLAPHTPGTAAPGPSKPPLLSHGPGQQPQQAPRFSKTPGPPVSRVIGTQQGDAKNENDRANALWAEMQNTLAEVELSASNTSHVFSAQHANALEDLRTAQLALAQAWAKSESEEDNHYPEDGEANIGESGTVEAQASPRSDAKEPGTANNTRERNLEEEAERDILLSRKRREANDKYFQQVNSGVLDVVIKLEDVANAMRQVEKKSKEIWNEGDSSESMIESGTEATESPSTNR